VLKKNKSISLILTFTLILSLVMTFLPIKINAATAPLVELLIDKDTLEKDDIFTLKVSLKNFDGPYANISSFQVDLSYDSTFIEPQQNKATFGSVYSNLKTTDYQIGINKIENGFVQFATSNYSKAVPFSGSGVLYSIPFKVLKGGETAIQIQKSIFIQKDKPGIELSHTKKDITLTVNSEDEGGSIPTLPEPPASTGPINGSPSDDENNGQAPDLELEPVNQFPRGKEKKVEEYKDLNEIKEMPWAFDSIKRLSELGIFTGGQDGNFKPSGLTTRAEFATILARALELEKATTTTLTNYIDVEQNEWFNEAIQTVAFHQLMIGRSNNGQLQFSPKGTITRGEIATIIVRALHLESKYNVENLVVPFTDIPNDWSKNGIMIAYTEGLIKGKNSNTFDPTAPATRAEVAVLVTRLIDYNPIGR